MFTYMLVFYKLQRTFLNNQNISKEITIKDLQKYLNDTFTMHVTVCAMKLSAERTLEKEA